MATLVLAGLLAGGGIMANKARSESMATRNEIIGATQSDEGSTLASFVENHYQNATNVIGEPRKQFHKNITAVLNRQVPNQRALGQNIYAVDDYAIADADLQARAEKVYPAAIQKEISGKEWGQSVLNGLDEGDGQWVNYAANPQNKEDGTIGSFATYPFQEEPYMKNKQLKKDGLLTIDPKRKFEQMTNIGTGGTGYRKKQEVLNVINPGENPISTNLIDNIDKLTPEKSLATTFDGTHLPDTGVLGVNDTTSLLKSYIATRKSTIDDKSVEPGLKTFAFDRMAGGNGHRDFNARAQLPQNYKVSHRRNVEGTMINGLQQARGFTTNMPQGYNHHELTQTMNSSKSNANRLTHLEGRVSNAVITHGQQGPNMGQVNGGAGIVPQIQLTTDQHRQTLHYGPERFTQVQLSRPAPDAVRGNILVPATRKEDTLFSHTGGISNIPRTTASYLSRTEPLEATGKQTLLRSSQGAAIQHAMPQQSMYQSQMQDWKRDLHNTNSNAYEGSLHRTPGAYVPGDHTRQMPATPGVTNKQLHAQEIGEMGPIGGMQGFVTAAAPRGWQAVHLSTNPEFARRQPDLLLGHDVQNTQLNHQEDAVAASYRGTKLNEVATMTQAGVASQANPVGMQLNQFRDAYHQTTRRTKGGP